MMEVHSNIPNRCAPVLSEFEFLTQKVVLPDHITETTICPYIETRSSPHVQWLQRNSFPYIWSSLKKFGLVTYSWKRKNSVPENFLFVFESSDRDRSGQKQDIFFPVRFWISRRREWTKKNRMQDQKRLNNFRSAGSHIQPVKYRNLSRFGFSVFSPTKQILGP
jgi:hypothetical protein